MARPGGSSTRPRCTRDARSGPSGPPSTSRVMRASRPAPAMTAKCSPFIFPRSSRRSRPESPTWTASPMSSGMPRFEAKRFAVPAGRIASRASVPAMASTARCIIPSPPQTKIVSAPSASAFSTRSGAYLLLGTSVHSGSVTPARSSVSRSSSSPPPIDLPACAMTATLVTWPSPRHGCARLPRWRARRTR